MKNDKFISRSTLDETPNRVLTFLRAAGTSGPIRRALAARGYTEKEHADGWDLLHKCASYRAPVPTVGRTAAIDAIRELDAMDEGLFRTTRATLERLHPVQAAFVFAGMEAGKGTAAILTMSTFLDRLDALEFSPDRLATRAEDCAALVTLAGRGLGAAERSRLRDLIAIAKNVSGEAVSLDDDAPDAQSEERTRDLIALRAWFIDWAETARLAITRRDQLVRMGLAQRRKAKDESEEDQDNEEPAVPTVPSLSVLNGSNTLNGAPV